MSRCAARGVVSNARAEGPAAAVSIGLAHEAVDGSELDPASWWKEELVHQAPGSCATCPCRRMEEFARSRPPSSAFQQDHLYFLGYPRSRRIFSIITDNYITPYRSKVHGPRTGGSLRDCPVTWAMPTPGRTSNTDFEICNWIACNPTLVLAPSPARNTHPDHRATGHRGDSCHGTPQRAFPRCATG